MALVRADIILPEVFRFVNGVLPDFHFFQQAMRPPTSISYASQRLLVRMDAAVPLEENSRFGKSCEDIFNRQLATASGRKIIPVFE